MLLLISPLTTLGLILPPSSVVNLPELASPVISRTPAYLRNSEPIPSPCAPHQTRVESCIHARFHLSRRSVLSLLARLGPSQSRNIEMLYYFGGNFLTAEGDGWRRQRRVGAPAFPSLAFGWTYAASSQRWLSKRIGRSGWQKMGKSRCLMSLTPL